MCCEESPGIHLQDLNEEHTLGTSWDPGNHLSFRFLANAEGSGGGLQPLLFIAEKKTARINRNSRGLTALTNPEMRRINGPAWELSWIAESESQVVSVQKLATN